MIEITIAVRGINENKNGNKLKFIAIFKVLKLNYFFLTVTFRLIRAFFLA